MNIKQEMSLLITHEKTVCNVFDTATSHQYLALQPTPLNTDRHCECFQGVDLPKHACDTSV